MSDDVGQALSKVVGLGAIGLLLAMVFQWIGEFLILNSFGDKAQV